MSLYTSDEIKELKANDPKALLSMLRLINGSLLIKDAEYKWTLAEVKQLVDQLNKDISDMKDDETGGRLTGKPITMSDSLLDKIRTEVLNNPRIVADDVVEPDEIEWDDILLTDAGIVDSYAMDSKFKPNADRSNMKDMPGSAELGKTFKSDEDAIVDSKPDRGFPASDSRILPDPSES